MPRSKGWLVAVALLFLALARLNATETAVVEARILTDLNYLASEECEGRGATTKGIHLAADYLAREFQKAGLKPGGKEGSYFQPFTIPGGAKLEGGSQANVLRLQGPQGQTFDLELGKGFNVVGSGSSGKVDAPIVFVGHGITSEEFKYDDYAGLDVAGKVVLVLRRTPESQPFAMAGQNNRVASIASKSGNAEAQKAAAVLFVNDNVTAAENKDELMSFGYLAANRETVSLPMAHLRRSFANLMVRSTTGMDLSEIERAIDFEGKPRSFELNGWRCSLQTSVQREATGVKNVVGVVEGSGPLADETIVIGAHYDHLGYGGPGSLARGSSAIHFGADDNASGTVCLIELARRFGGMPERKGRRLVFIAFAGEELGLLGSAYYCRNPLYPLDKTVTMVNMDMVGRLREDKLTIGGVGTAKNFDSLIDELNKKAKFNVAKDKHGSGPSDHQSFYRQRIPVFFFFTGMHQQYHRPTDTADTINVAGIRRVAEMVEELVEILATDEKRPEYVHVPGVFNPNQSGRPAGPRLGIMPGNYQDADGGVLVDDVAKDGPAEKGGIQKNDRIIDIGGKPVKNIQSYMSVMGGLKRGDKVEITLIRDGKEVKLPVVLE